MDQDDDARLIALAQAGLVPAYKELVRRYQTIAFRVAYVILHDPEEAEDTTQEAFLKVYTALNRFRRGAPFRPWLLKIVGNEARNRRRAQRRSLSRLVGLDEIAVIRDTAPLPDQVVLQREEHRRIVAALDTLRAEEQAVLTCRYFLGLSEAETAATLGIRRGTVKSRLSRALDHVRAAIQSDPAPLSGTPTAHRPEEFAP